MPAGRNSSPRSRHLHALKPHQAALKTHRSHQHEAGEGARKKLRLRDLPAPRARLHHRPGCLSAPARACTSTGISWRTSPRHSRTPATATVEQTPLGGRSGKPRRASGQAADWRPSRPGHCGRATRHHVTRPRESARRPHFCSRLQTNYLAGSGGSGPPLGRGRARRVRGPGGGARLRSDRPPRLCGDAVSGAGGPRSQWGRGAARPAGRRGGEGGGPQSGSIRFSHRPRGGSQQTVRRRLRDRFGLARASHPAPPRCPRGRLARTERRRRSPSAAPRGCRPSPPLPRWTRSRKRPRERISHRIKKCKQKGSGEQRANKLKWPTSKPRICPQRTERPRTRVQPLKEKRKKPSPTNHPSCLSVSLPPFLYNPEEYFYRLFCKCEFFSSSRNIFKRWGEILPHPIF